MTLKNVVELTVSHQQSQSITHLQSTAPINEENSEPMLLKYLLKILIAIGIEWKWWVSYDDDHEEWWVSYDDDDDESVIFINT